MTEEYTTKIVPEREAKLLQAIKDAGMKIIDEPPAG
jgi:TRAP-type C4-dicarboxylate transport system substrate-binding protein